MYSWLRTVSIWARMFAAPATSLLGLLFEACGKGEAIAMVKGFQSSESAGACDLREFLTLAVKANRSDMLGFRD